MATSRFIESIRPVIEYFIENGYIQQSWTDNEFSEYIQIHLKESENRSYVRFDEITINNELYKYVYLGYKLFPPTEMHHTYFRELKFIIYKYETYNMPRHIWEGWIYFQPNGKQIKPYNLYIDKCRSYVPE
jgi:hypothetical protein